MTDYQKNKLNNALRAYVAANDEKKAAAKVVDTNKTIIEDILIPAGITSYDCKGAHCTCTEISSKPTLDEGKVRELLASLGIAEIPATCYKAPKTDKDGNVEKSYRLTVKAA